MLNCESSSHSRCFQHQALCKLHEGSVTALWCGYQAIKTEVFVNLPSYFLAPLRLAAAVDVFGGKNVRMTP